MTKQQLAALKKHGDATYEALCRNGCTAALAAFLTELDQQLYDVTLRLAAMEQKTATPKRRRK